ncbi:MAG: patatin-like phospholipase family protein [Pseudomonadota bacterium]
MKSYIRYRAGRGIIDLIKEEGLRPERIRVFAGPAGGPKWFVSVGFDRAVINTGLLLQGHKVLLAGSSAGAWRCLAIASRDPLSAYERLRIGYSRNVFTERDTPRTVSDAFRRTVEAFLTDEDIRSILDHPSYRTALHVVRSKGPTASENRRIEGAGILLAALANVFAPRGMDPFYDRAVFFTGDQPPGFVEKRFRGLGIRLTTENLRDAALATGSLPYIMRGVSDIPGAPPGVYRDGGIRDYQYNQDYMPSDDGLTLFFHYQERIVPGWFDKKLSWRTPPGGSLDRVLQVYPGPDFVSLLPDGRIPDRKDFIEFASRPAERIRRWDEVSETSEILATEFFDHVNSGKIRNLVQPLT